MKNREIIMRRLEKAEGNIAKLFLILQRAGSRDEFEIFLRDTQEVLQDAKSFVQQEPLGPNEIN
jgi:competence protein ComGF